MMMTIRQLGPVAAAAALAVTLPVLAASTPATPWRGPIAVASYDGVSNDLLTAGLGKTGLMGAAPAYANPLAPTAAELRRNAIYTNYRALVDISALGGMGVLYGPNIDAQGADTLGEGKIAGTEYIVWADDGTGAQNVTLMVQVPTSFNPARPCIITGTSSGSRGIYGAIATSGEWGLKRGCAVAYTDKGSGNGFHDLMTDTVTARDGSLLNAATAGTEAQFKAAVSAEDLAAFNAATPHRVAYKHAHSQQLPDKDWGRNTLDAVRFALHVLNTYHTPAALPNAGAKAKGASKPFYRANNTVVIASSVSNGGGAALSALEQDTERLIDGVAVSEPNAQPYRTPELRIQQGEQLVPKHSRLLLDYFTHANVYQACAVLSPQAGIGLSPLFWPAAYTASAEARCNALAAKGLIQGETLTDKADAALAQMRAYGWQAESDFLQASHFRFATNAIAVTYTNAYGRFSVTDSVCGYSFANTDVTGAVVPQLAVVQAGLFASGNGVPPTSGVNVVWNSSVGGAKLDFLAASPSSGTADFALDGALCLRSLVTGRDPVTRQPLTGLLKTQSDRVRAGLSEVRQTAKLRGRPVMIVAGRNDALLPVNHTARAYYGRHLLKDGQPSQASYVEVTNAQHFDSFISFGPLLGYDTRYVPLHVYFNRALDAVWARLTEGTPLPPSQVVRTTPRASSVTPLGAANVPAIASSPAVADQIVLTGTTLRIPD
ncbi:D-(-)-3-hydroxybutyrate oligomer hydrolase [Ideonella paludis]|uniref:D-(-)-3-hydroxybutyrate oligomer hydrolase n=1 Tax=Ideonella paludis TaxID=1233411 RepID=A0ABS5DWA2_9BURK|nr:D-(-)-3-hydroxybutyrate oligomer hydrolase [Ideonella paludis]MBQ0935417.1 D-(-)-3-hydroxybutyrate oligomer hydrolase [Ideonella paludis]